MHAAASTPISISRQLLVLAAVSMLLVACGSQGSRAGSANATGSPPGSAGASSTISDAPQPTSPPEPTIAGVSAECADAVKALIRADGDAYGDPAYDVISRCASEAEVTAAADALGADAISGDPAWFLDEACSWWRYDGPACPAVPTPTPYVATIAEDAAWRSAMTDLCLAARPADLLSATAEVVPLADGSAYEHVWVRIAEYIGVDGIPTEIPPLARGYVYDTEYDTPSLSVDLPSDVELVACITLQAFEHEQWYPSSQNGCPCYPYDASRALIWMVDPATGGLVGQPWLRPAADVDHGATTDMLLGGVDHGLGIRPPEQTDLVADIEAFLGR